MKAVLLLFVILSTTRAHRGFLNNLDVDILSKPTYDDIIYANRHLHDDDHAEHELSRARRQVTQPESFRQLSLPQIQIPFR
jgi:hypothetical protein